MRTEMRRSPKNPALWASVLLLAVGGLGLVSAGSASAQTQGAMNQAASRAFQQTDANMTVQYRKLRAVLTPVQRALLQKSQAAWLKFRDAEAAFLSLKAQGGSVYPMVYARHLQELTQARSQQLQKAYVLYKTEGEM